MSLLTIDLTGQEHLVFKGTSDSSALDQIRALLADVVEKVYTRDFLGWIRSRVLVGLKVIS
jgi:hypothetical protein